MTYYKPSKNYTAKYQKTTYQHACGNKKRGRPFETTSFFCELKTIQYKTKPKKLGKPLIYATDLKIAVARDYFN